MRYPAAMSIVGTHKLHVVLPVPQKEGYDYLCPAGGEAPAPGACLLAPLGKRELSGVVWGEAKDEVPPEKMKPLLAVHDLPPMTQGMRVFLERAAAYTLSPLGV